MGFGTRTVSPVSRVVLDLVGVIYVNDTNLMLIDAALGDPLVLWEQCQHMSTAWGRLFILTGGALKSMKCFHYMVDYEWGEVRR